MIKIHLEKRVLQCFCLAVLFLSLEIKTRNPPLQFTLAKCFHSKNYSHFQDYNCLVSFSGAEDTTNTHEVCNLNSILGIQPPLQPKCNLFSFSKIVSSSQWMFCINQDLQKGAVERIDVAFNISDYYSKLFKRRYLTLHD